MKAVILLFALLVYANGNLLAQNSFTDPRDGQSYPIVSIGSTIWFADNLKFQTSFSDTISAEIHQKYPSLSGRFYHLEELDSICPTGWRLPDSEDWLDYFEYVAKSADKYAPIKFTGDVKHFALDGYDQNVDLFEDGNPLNLKPTGWVQGSAIEVFDNLASYWTLDPPTYETTGTVGHIGHVHVMPEVVAGKTHIHIRRTGFTNIHSHKHHLDPKKRRKMRKFMVRCVKL